MRALRRASFATLVLTGFAVASVGVAAPAGAAPAKSPPTVTVMVTNDDGVGAPGLDALVEALRKVKHTKVVVVAPASNQSNTGGQTTPGPLATADANTASGDAATAVDGTPADTVTVALDQLGLKPDVVMSGINSVQNYGTIVPLSGTVGAARQAAKRGVPALAFSQGKDGTPQYDRTAALAVAWLRAHRKQLLAGTAPPPTTITSYNVPNCPSGKPRGVLHVETAPDLSEAAAPLDCTAKGPRPTTDVEAFNQGYAAVTQVPLA